jgi:ribosomal subunit interface protein
MQVVVNGKNMDVGEALRTHVNTTLTDLVRKYFSNSLDANVTFSQEAHLFRADCTVHVARDLHVYAHATDTDPYACFNIAAQKLEKRLRRYKRRITDHHKRRHDASEVALAAAYSVFPSADETDEEVINDANGAPLTIAESTTNIPVLTVGDAVMRLDVSDEPVLLFRNNAHGELNVVYRRKDGNIGWVDPGAQKKA